MIALMLLVGCVAAEPPLEEWTGCVLEDHPIDIINTGSRLLPDDGEGEGDMLVVGSPWTGLELARTSSGLFIELPSGLSAGDKLRLTAIDSLYNRTRGRWMMLATRNLTGTLQLLSTEADIERYGIDATAIDFELRSDGQPASVELVGELTVRRIAGSRCVPPTEH